MFKLVVISSPEECRNETEAMQLLASNAYVHAIHLRKPDWSLQKTHLFLSTLPDEVLRKVRLHNHFSLGKTYPIQGFHLNQRSPEPPSAPITNSRLKKELPLSASCHSLEEVALKLPQCDYVFLSPIFDSISKQGYSSCFNTETIHEGMDRHLIGPKTIALGGIDAEKIPLVKKWGFGGIAVLGSLWGKFATNPDLNLLEKQLKILVEACQR